MKHSFRITVKQISKTLSDVNDVSDNPSGTFIVYAHNKNEALDYFHRNHPIGCLDDFDISIRKYKPIRIMDASENSVRFTFNWTVFADSGRCIGEVIRNEWSGSVVNLPFKTDTFKIIVDKNSISMKPSDGNETFKMLSKREDEFVKSVARSYYHGANFHKEAYFWSSVKED